MAAAPRLLPYMVSLLFGGGGPLAINAVLAPSPEAAAAILALEVLRATGTEGELAAVAVTPLAPDFLRAAVRAVEGTLSVDGGNVLSLVPTGIPGEVPYEESSYLHQRRAVMPTDGPEPPEAA